MERAVIHLNVADFPVAVERALDPRLRDRPVIVAPEGAARAAVFDMSEEAYRSGVRKGMALPAALGRCRDAYVLPPRPARYEQAMGALVRAALPYSPRVEPGEGDGHLFLDMTGAGRLFGPPMDVAWRLRKAARADLNLDPIWSVAPNKLVAKVATRLVKPAGEYIVGAGEEAPFLAPLPLALLPGVAPADLARLRDFNLTRVREAAALTRDQLETAVGKRAGFLHDTVRGIDPSPVRRAGEGPPTVILDHAFAEETNHGPALEAGLHRLAETAGAELRRRRLAARNVAVALDHADGVRRVRRRAASPATADDFILFDRARSALHLAWHRRVRVRRLRLICDRLVHPPPQMALFPELERPEERRADLLAAMDRIRARFGRDAVTFGRLLATPA